MLKSIQKFILILILMMSFVGLFTAYEITHFLEYHRLKYYFLAISILVFVFIWRLVWDKEKAFKVFLRASLILSLMSIAYIYLIQGKIFKTSQKEDYYIRAHHCPSSFFQIGIESIIPIIGNERVKSEFAQFQDLCRVLKLYTEFKMDHKAEWCVGALPSDKLKCYQDLIQGISEHENLNKWGQLLSLSLGTEMSLSTYTENQSKLKTFDTILETGKIQWGILKRWMGLVESKSIQSEVSVDQKTESKVIDTKE